MCDEVKKKRIRSVILMSALGAIACGGQVTGQDPGDDGYDRARNGDGDGDGDSGFIGQPPTGGGGTGGLMVVGTGGSIYVGVPVGEPPYYGGAGGAEPADDDFDNR